MNAIDPAPLLDENLLRQWLEAFGRARLRGLIGTYRASSAGNFAALQAALDAGDGETAGRAAHKIAGAAANLGFSVLYGQAREAEACARKGEMAAALGQADAMAETQTRSLMALEAWLAGAEGAI